MVVKFYLNGVQTEVNVKPGAYLLDTLRDIGVKSVKKGCDGSLCGACTVLLNDKPVLSCSVLMGSIEGKNVTTVEGIQEDAAKLADCFSKQGADQCGYCNAAYALTVHALLKENPNPSEEEIKEYLVGNLCRCTGYQAIVQAVRIAAEKGEGLW